MKYSRAHYLSQAETWLTVAESDYTGTRQTTLALKYVEIYLKLAEFAKD